MAKDKRYDNWNNISNLEDYAPPSGNFQKIRRKKRDKRKNWKRGKPRDENGGAF